MTHDPSTYSPISCEFHDRLEALALLGTPSRIRFHGDDGAPQQRDAKIRDVFSRAGAEYVSISTGETVRLDRLIEAGGARLADH